MDKLNELIDFYEMTEDEPELLVMLLELRRHRQENWKQRAEAAWAEAKHQLGVNVVLSRHNQAIVAQRDKALSQLSELARQEPDYFLNRIESSDKWGPETDLRIYESQLGASKSQDDHGGGIIELFTRPAPAAVPVDLVPDDSDLAERHTAWLNTLQRPMFSDEDWEELSLYTWLAFRDSFRAYRAEIQRRIEERQC